MLEAIKPFDASMPVLDVSEVVELEQKVANAGTSLLTLMIRAGASVTDVAKSMLGESEAFEKRIIILAGSGNNGGDGWVAASDLVAQGYDVTLVSKASAEELKAESARTAAIDASHKGGFRIVLSPNDAELEQLLSDADLVIDAILGTGFAHSEVRPPYCTWIELANSARSNYGVPILSVDCPSGLNAQTGNAAESCIIADKTITMIAAKTGLVQETAAPYMGELLVAPIGVSL